MLKGNFGGTIIKLFALVMGSMAVMGITYVLGLLIVGYDILLPLEMVLNTVWFLGGGFLVILFLSIIGATLVSLYAINHNYRPSQIHPDFKYMIRQGEQNKLPLPPVYLPETASLPEDSDSFVDADSWREVPKESLV